MRRFRTVWGILALSLIALSLRSVIALTQGYQTADSGLKPGMAVSLNSSSTSAKQLVQRADYRSADKVLGISVSLDNSLVTAAAGEDTVYVANNGKAQAYLSDLNGIVKKGDSLALSPLAGILAKSGPNSEGTVGIALSDFPNNYQTISPLDTAGKTVHTKLALMPIDVNLIVPAQAPQQENWLERLGQTVTGRQVGSPRLATAALIFIVLIVIEGTIVYSAVSKSLISIGRNPLAGVQVRQQAMRSFGLALAFLLIGGAIIVVLLWL